MSHRQPIRNEPKPTPQSLEAEMSTLGACLMEKSALEYCEQIELLPDHFYREINRKIYRGMLKLHRSGWDVDLITMVETLRKYGHLESVGGAAYLTALVEICPNAKSIQRYAAFVMEASRMRSLLILAEKLTAAVYEDGAESLLIIRELSPTLKMIGEGGVLLPDTRLQTAIPDSHIPPRISASRQSNPTLGSH